MMLPITVVHPEQPGPQTVRPKEPATAEETCQDGALAGIKVLVVDDEPDARQLLRRVLAECHAEVALAASAAEALELVERFRPDVIVSDIGMPETDGYDFIRRVRAVYTARQIPAAALTAFARIGGPQTGLARRLPDAHRQARGPGRADGRRRQPGLPDRHERPAQGRHA